MGNNNPFGRVDGGLAAYMRKVYLYMAGGVGFTSLIALWLMGNPATLAAFVGNPILFWGAILVQLGLVLGLSFGINRISSGTALGLFGLYSGLTGLTIAPLVYLYTSESVASVFLIAAGMFGALSAYGYVTKRDLGPIGAFLFMALIGLVLASIVNLFIASSGFAFILNIAGVFIFAGLTAYDTQKIKEMYGSVANDEEATNKAAIFGALTLYLDFINLFINLLRLFGNRK
jgi:FtsH-binding integral membrane protein